MAKAKKNLVQLINSEIQTPTKYLAKLATKGPKAGQKLSLMKYDPVTRKHHLFVSKKLPSPK